jgi:hypothetical protein
MTKLSRLVVCEKLMRIEKTKRRNDIKSNYSSFYPHRLGHRKRYDVHEIEYHKKEWKNQKSFILSI